MKKYTYSETANYYVAKAKDAKTAKQAWFYYYKLRNVVRFYDLTDEQFAKHKDFVVKFGEAIKNKFSGEVAETTKPQKTTSSAPAPKLAEPTQPAVSKNGRTNNALRVQAVITNLEASIEILRAIK